MYHTGFTYAARWSNSTKKITASNNNRLNGKNSGISDKIHRVYRHKIVRSLEHRVVYIYIFAQTSPSVVVEKMLENKGLLIKLLPFVAILSGKLLPALD